MKPTYDEHQMAAQLRLCKVCRREKWMTAPQAICIRCREDERKALAALGSSLSSDPVRTR